jgi:hypothetical protein
MKPVKNESARKNLRVVKGSKNSDNKAKKTPEAKPHMELTCTAESKDVLENLPTIQSMMKQVHEVTLSYIQEIQKLGETNGVVIKIRPIFDMQKKGE